MSFDLTPGEWILTAFVFALVYSAGFLPKITAKLGGAPEKRDG